MDFGTAGASSPRRLLYGRRQGPKLRQGAKDLLSKLLPRVQFAVAPGMPLDPLALFDRPPRALWLEIGFGGGEHLAARAAAHPDVGFLGVEPFINGVARLLRAIELQGLSNVRILKDDARLLLQALPSSCLDRAFILFPDPWPKARHHKRRIVNAVTLAELSRLLRPGGELQLATDDADYARWMLSAALRERGLCWSAERAVEWREPPPAWVPTRYEAKARAAGRRPVFLQFKRR